jgi:alpha-1,6-mannosyltransferase
MAIEQHGVTAPAAPGTVPEYPTTTEKVGVSTRVAALVTRLSPAAEPRSAHVVAGRDSEPERAAAREATVPKRAYIRLVLAGLCGFAGSLILVGTSPVWRLAPESFRLIVPGLNHPGDSFYSGAAFVLGIALMAIGWIGLIGHLSRLVGPERTRVKVVLVLTLLWSIPLLLGPVLVSNDAYSYSAQGYMASLGIDPSASGPDALPVHAGNEFWTAAEPLWKAKPAPYGPVAVGAAKAVVTLTGFDVAHAVLGFRFLAVLGVAMAGVGIYLIASRRRVSPALALALAIANPVVMIHLIGGAHNDALMMGLLLLGLASFERGRKVLAVVLVTFAVCVKLPAVVALAFIAWNWKGKDAHWKERLVGLPIVGGIAASVIAVLCLVVGIGLGWITALQSTGTVYSTFAVFTKLGFVAADISSGLGMDVDPFVSVEVFRALGLLFAAAVIVYLLLRSPRMDMVKAVGFSLLVLVLAGPVVWPWYLPVGFALLAAGGSNRYRPSMIVLTIASSLLVWPTSVNAIEGLVPYQHWLGIGVVLLIAGLCVGAQLLARAVENRRERRALGVPILEAVLVGPAESVPVG